jgi:uncharacterized membrane protein
MFGSWNDEWNHFMTWSAPGVQTLTHWGFPLQRSQWKAFSLKNGKSIKCRVFCPCFIPDKFLPLLNFHHLFPIETLRLFILMAKNRDIQTGIQIIFIDANG